MRALFEKHPLLWRFARIVPVLSASALAGQSAANPEIPAKASARVSVQIRSAVRLSSEAARDGNLSAPSPVERACPKAESDRHPGCTMKIVDMP